MDRSFDLLAVVSPAVTPWCFLNVNTQMKIGHKKTPEGYGPSLLCNIRHLFIVSEGRECSTCCSEGIIVVTSSESTSDDVGLTQGSKPLCSPTVLLLLWSFCEAHTHTHTYTHTHTHTHGLQTVEYVQSHGAVRMLRGERKRENPSLLHYRSIWPSSIFPCPVCTLIPLLFRPSLQHAMATRRRGGDCYS